MLTDIVSFLIYCKHISSYVKYIFKLGALYSWPCCEFG